ncbi:MAG: hypothetical protein J3K34DRAFT_124375 [Monoraphidium minutum]|nr:MAG: hypothetical protein J3K34DRAFT_124375 [Monoraphidium minutum]
MDVRRFDPAKHCWWAAPAPPGGGGGGGAGEAGQPAQAGGGGGGGAPYMALALAFAAVDGTKSRLQIDTALTNFFRSVLALAPGDLEAAVYLTLGKIAPDHEGSELSVGGATVSAALADATGAARGAMRGLYARHGDLGDVALALKKSQSTLVAPPPLTLRGVLRALRGFAADRGQGSAGRRQAAVARLLRACRDVEVRYLVRTLISNLRIGAGWRSVVGPLAKAALIHREGPGWAARVTKAALDGAAAAAAAAYHTCPDPGLLAATLAAHGPAGLASRLGPRPGVPLQPMLANAATGVAAALGKLGAGCGPLLAEWKYDGMRAQIHIISDTEARVFSRNCQDSTAAHGDAAARLRAAAAPGALPLIVDAEVVGVRRLPAGGQAEGAPGQQQEEGRGHADDGGGGGEGAAAAAPRKPYTIRSFQELSTRPRSGGGAGGGGGAGAAAAPPGVDVCVFVFDAICVGGEVITGLPLRERRARLAAALPGVADGYVELAAAIEVRRGGGGGGGGAEGAVESGVARAAQEPQHEEQRQEQQELVPGGEESEGAEGDEVNEEAAAPSSDDAEASGSDDGGGSGAGSGDEGAAPDAEARAVDGRRRQPGAAEGGGRDKLGNGRRARRQEDKAAGGGGGGGGGGGEGEDAEAEAAIFGFFEAALASGAEGLMLKRLDGPGAAYAPAKRSDAWVKLKRDYFEGLADSFDAVPIGAWRGQGRKVKWLSPFLLAVWDPEAQEFQSLCRVMSGFSDAFYAAATERLMATAIPGPKPYYNTGETCGVWFEPTEVWEVRGADLSISPVHRAAAGRVDDARGIGLRFPRFVRLRPDKGIEDASGPDLVEGLYRKQSRRAVA